MKKIMRLFLIIFLVGMMSVPSFAANTYVYDEAGLLDAGEEAKLNAKAASVAEKYGCGIYMVTVDDYQEYGNGDVYTTATQIYHGLELGEGADREGILLMLSMDDRDYATFFYGEQVEYAFVEYGQILLEEEFLDDFGSNRWYDGFEDYISTCDEYLGLAAAGNPVRESFGYMYVIVVGVSLLIAFIVTMVMRASMMSVKKGGMVNAYVTEEGLNLTERSDWFLYNTQTRRKIERSSSGSGSRSHSGGGGSGRSGKF